MTVSAASLGPVEFGWEVIAEGKLLLEEMRTLRRAGLTSRWPKRRCRPVHEAEGFSFGVRGAGCESVEFWKVIGNSPREGCMFKGAGFLGRYGEGGIVEGRLWSLFEVWAAYSGTEHRHCWSESGWKVDELFGNRVRECRRCRDSPAGLWCC